jgi:hypothetical protein
MRCAAFAGRDTADDLGAIFRAALGVEGAFAASDALNDETSILY